MNPSPVIVHPSQFQTDSFQRVSIPNPIAPLREVFIVIVSKHSPSCSKIFETIKFIAPHLNTKILEIDNPEVRNIVLTSGKIKTVPTIALMYPQDNKVDFYEGTSALQLLQQKVEEVQQKIQRIAASSPKATDIAQVLAMPQQTQYPVQMPATPAPMQELYPPQAQIAVPPQGHYPDPNDMRASPLDRNPATVTSPEESREMGPAEVMGGTLIDDSAYEVDMENTVPQGMSREEIMGGDQALINREKDKKSKANQGRMEAMMREREEMDKKTLDPRIARRP
jgi:hypothetical protein